MKRKYTIRFSILTAIILLLSLFTGIATAATETPIKVVIDGQTLESDAAPLISEGRVLVPFRAIFEALGAAVNWDAASSTAMGRKGPTCIFIQPNNKNAMLIKIKPEYTDLELTDENLEAAVESVENMTLDVPAMNKNGRLLVPVRFIAESLGAKVEWKADSRTVSINTNGEAPASQPDDTLVGFWGSDMTSLSNFDNAGNYTGAGLSGEWWKFEADGTYTYIIIFNKGGAIEKGKYRQDDTKIYLSDSAEKEFFDTSAAYQSVPDKTWRYYIETSDGVQVLRMTQFDFTELQYFDYYYKKEQ